MVFFPNCTIEIYEPVEGECCQYTGERIDSWELTHTVKADFQPDKDSDNQTEYGKELTDIYNIYIDLTTPVTDKSRIKIVGEESTYEVIGSPEKWNRFHNFWKIKVQKHRKPSL